MATSSSPSLTASKLGREIPPSSATACAENVEAASPSCRQASSLLRVRQHSLPSTWRMYHCARTFSGSMAVEERKHLWSSGFHQAMPSITSRRRKPATAVAALSDDSFWAAVSQAVAVAVLIGSVGVVAGLLLRWRLWTEAKKDAERFVQEGQGLEELLLEQSLRLMSSDASAGLLKSGGDSDGHVVDAAAAAAAGSREGGGAALAGAQSPRTVEERRRNRPVRRT
eukprot:TRINITY_DN1317_c0_g1_i3.p1 TRINITY_DN1317_c0_g1~~TRINITY_DN1317_c0_g1_i3.p1  ORF type:complete len:226 (+),score=55.70 TRINITY_DN1317_c0_g1_i3:69-746(+)